MDNSAAAVSEERVGKVLRRVSDKFTTQRIWATEWQELADYNMPRKNSILVQRVPGSKRTQKLYDSTAIDAAELLSASINGTLSPSHMRWFYLETDDLELNKIQSVTKWCQDASELMNTALNRSNFHAESHEFYTELAVFGTGALFEEEKPKSQGKFGGLQFTSLPIGKYAVAEGPDNLVNAIYRSFPMSTESIATRWPNTAPDQYLNKEKKPDEQHEVLHAIYPSERTTLITPAWYSDYILTEGKVLLSAKGFNSFPCMVTRWTKNSDEEYGRGPGHTSIPDVRSLSKIIELELKAIAKVVDPPMGAVQGDVIGAARLVPGGVTSVRSKDALFPILNGIDFKISNLKKQELRESIKSIYKIDQLQLPQGGPQMTATESNLRYELMQRILGPTLGRLEIEFAKPLIDRTFDIMWRAGALPPLPVELRQATRNRKIQLRIRYEGPLARAQKSSDVTSIQNLNDIIGKIAPTKPEILDVIDWDAEVRFIAKTLGVPAEIVRDQQAVEALRQAHEEQMQKQQQMQQQGALAEQAKNVSPLVRSLNQRPEPGSGMEQLQNGTGTGVGVKQAA